MSDFDEAMQLVADIRRLNRKREDDVSEFIMVLGAITKHTRLTRERVLLEAEHYGFLMPVR